VLIVVVGIGGFYYFVDKPELVRVLVLLASFGAAVAVALQTAPGRSAWEFAKASRMELRKVVWPSNKETMQMTLLVVVMVVLIALFLWFVDLGLLKGVKLLTGRGA
jgi:preprotein translocase subunit SecE